jgi:hypothetical protein
MRSWRWYLLFGIVVSALLGGGAAGAKKKPRKGGGRAAVDEKAMGELMGPFKFGSSRDEVLRVLRQEIDARYKEQLEATTDVYVQDKLRRDRKKELDRIKNSYVEFKGAKTGWDVSIIDDQFARNTGEAMMEYWEHNPATGSDQRRFFFFFDGRLYKMFIALSSKMLKEEQKNFAFFQQLMEGRYGPGNVEMRTESDGKEVPDRITWSSPRYNVVGLDRLDFHGSFCLTISDPRTEKKLIALRAERNPGGKKENPLIKAMVEDPEKDKPDLSGNREVVDSILKK